MTSTAVCVEGFCKKDKFQLCAWTTSVAVCAEVFCKKGAIAECAYLQLSAQFVEDREDLQLSAQIRTMVFVKS